MTGNDRNYLLVWTRAMGNFRGSSAQRSPAAISGGQSSRAGPPEAQTDTKQKFRSEGCSQTGEFYCETRKYKPQQG